MPDKPNQEHEQQPKTQKLPKTGLEVPVPTRKSVMDAITRASKADEQGEETRPAGPESAQHE